jgi:hypothetical protein
MKLNQISGGKKKTFPKHNHLPYPCWIDWGHNVATFATALHSSFEVLPLPFPRWCHTPNTNQLNNVSTMLQQKMKEVYEMRFTKNG